MNKQSPVTAHDRVDALLCSVQKGEYILIVFTKFSNSGVTLLKIRGAKVVQGQDFMTITGGDEYKKAWGDIR